MRSKRADGPGEGVSTWSCPPPPVDPARILRVHKYTDPDRVRPVIRRAAETSAEAAAELSRPAASHVAVPIKSLKDGELSLEGGIRFHCPAFDEHLEGCTRLLAFVATLGPRLDERVVSLLHDTFEPLDALFLETAGWLTIEAATRELARELKRRAGEEGWKLTLRLGPGYDYRDPSGEGRVRWDLTEQEGLFAMFGDAPLPVELTEVCAMLPKMSRSGAFGMRPANAGAEPAPLAGGGSAA